MRSRNSFVLLLFLFVVLLTGVVSGCGSDADNGDSNEGVTTTTQSSGQPKMPSFSLDRLGGGRLTDEDILGRPTVINFEGSWCGPCELEAPAFANASKTLTDVAFIGIAVKDSDEAQQNFIDKHGWTFPIGMDYTGAVVTDFQREALVPRGAIPMTFFIDSQGNIVDVWIGPILDEDLTRMVGQLLEADAASKATETGATSTGTSTDAAAEATAGATT